MTGGERTLTETGGYFVAPTIFDDVRNTMITRAEEIFGPVISLVPFDDEDEAIALANQTSYGLAASVYTTNLDRAIFARAIRAGTVGVNAYSEGDIYDTIRRLQGVRLRRPRQGPRGVRAVHREEDDLVRPRLIAGRSREWQCATYLAPRQQETILEGRRSPERADPRKNPVRLSRYFSRDATNERIATPCSSLLPPHEKTRRWRGRRASVG